MCQVDLKHRGRFLVVAVLVPLHPFLRGEVHWWVDETGESKRVDLVDWDKESDRAVASASTHVVY